MRKYHKKLILELMETLLSTMQEAKKLASPNLLADCQEGAIEIGNYIEEAEGEGHISVKYLEEYCELLYHASLSLTEPVNDPGIFKKLERQQLKIINSIKNDIKTTLEVIFLPYKASMFDSFESIWLAFNDDPDCEAYVMPIPYHDKSPNGELGLVHYEKDEYPDDVPVVDYKSYDIKERQPDIIFIHNPYDNANYVTSVHPEFYAEKLRNYTDMLVYVPYFITDDELEDHFAVLPATIYAHKVIAQSEKIKKEYLKHYKNFEKSNGVSGRFGLAEDKFLALGSPKFDAIMNKKKTDFQLPSEWENIEKKVIFYNTTIAGLLKGDNKSFDKLRYVFSCFKENENAILLWRPHPLSLSTLESMRPQLVNEYQAIVEEYQKSGNGIYDDSPDLHRALAFSDGYYGDGSSLAIMYGMTGKPVIVQNHEDLSVEIHPSIPCFTIDDDGSIWGCELTTNRIYSIDLQQNLASYLFRYGKTPRYFGAEKESAFRYLSSFCAGDLVIFLPYFVSEILIYNRKTKKQTVILLDEKVLIKADWSGFAIYETVFYQDKLYCFSSYAKALIVLNLNSLEVSYDTALYDSIGAYLKNRDYVKFRLHLSEVSADGQVYLLMRECEQLIRYSLVTKKVEFITANPIIKNSLLAAFDGNDYWLLGEKNGKLYRWNHQTNVYEEYLIPFLLLEKEYTFTKMVDFGSYLLLFPCLGRMILKFDKETQIFSDFKDMPIPEDKKVKAEYLVKEINDKVFAYAVFNSTIYELDKISGQITPHKFKLERASIKSRFGEYFADFLNNNDNKDAYFENNIGNIADFFTSLFENGINEKQKEKFLNYSINKDGTAGKNIYEKIKKEVVG